VWQTKQAELAQQYAKNGFNISCKEDKIKGNVWSMFVIVSK